jgi:hypothetical protein
VATPDVTGYATDEFAMANRKLKTWAEVKARRPLSAEAQAANATWVEQQIIELNPPDRSLILSRPAAKDTKDARDTKDTNRNKLP